jgi:hypothetical protein
MKTSLIAVSILVAQLVAAQERPTTLFECNCALGQNGTTYHVKLVQEYGPGRATINFTKSEQSAAKNIILDGTLDGFQYSGAALILQLVDPGPHTVVFSEDEGSIRKVFDCKSFFSVLFAGRYAVCFAGKRVLGDGTVVPQTAAIYDGTVHPYKQMSTVPFAMTYAELSKLTPK